MAEIAYSPRHQAPSPSASPWAGFQLNAPNGTPAPSPRKAPIFGAGPGAQATPQFEWQSPPQGQVIVDAGLRHKQVRIGASGPHGVLACMWLAAVHGWIRKCGPCLYLYVAMHACHCSACMPA